MRYVAFPSHFYEEEAPPLECLLNSSIRIVSGPTTSGLYIIEGSKEAIELLKSITEYYLFMEDFDQPN